MKVCRGDEGFGGSEWFAESVVTVDWIGGTMRRESWILKQIFFQ